MGVIFFSLHGNWPASVPITTEHFTTPFRNLNLSNVFREMNVETFLPWFILLSFAVFFSLPFLITARFSFTVDDARKIVFPRLIQSRSTSNQLSLVVSDTLTLDLTKSSVFSDSVKIRKHEGRTSIYKFVSFKFSYALCPFCGLKYVIPLR